MAKIKCNKGGIASLINYVNSLKDKLGAIYTTSIKSVQTYNNNAVTSLGSALGRTNATVSDGKGGTIDNPVYLDLKAKKVIADNNALHLANALGKQTGIEDILGKVIEGLSKIEKAINNFESETGDVTFTVTANKRTVVNQVTGIEVTQLVFTVTDPDGNSKDYTISELLNAFYSTQGIEMNSVYQAALLREELGLGPLTDEDLMHVLQTSGSIMNFVFDIGMYGISSEEDLKNYKKNLKDAGFDVSEDVDSLIKSVDFGDDELKKKVLNYLLSATNGAIYPGAVSAAVNSLYGLYNNDSEIVLKQEENNNNNDNNNNNNYDNNNGYSYSSGGGSTGGSYGGSNRGTTPATQPTSPKEPIDPVETPTEPTITESLTETVTEPIPGIVSPTEGYTDPLVTPEDASELPTEIIPSIPEDIIVDYDDLARQQFEAQGEEAISEHRADIVAKANTLFAYVDKTELKEILKKYGYSDSDIEIIIQDRNMTVSAMISGDQREQLAKIARELAEKDGLTEFDTVYDNEQSSAALSDGTVVKLLSIVSGDEGVKKAYGELAQAEKSYTDANTAAVDAMAAVTVAQNKLAEVTNSIGEKIKTEPSQWDEATLNAYNDEVTKLYENTIKTNGISSKWTAEQKKEYNAKVEAIKAQYAEKTALTTDKALWTTNQASQYNEAMKEYNNAVKAAKEAMTKLGEAKKAYSEAKLVLDTAKEDFYTRMIKEQKDMERLNAEAGVVDPVDTQVNSGNPVIEGIEITEQGASISRNNNQQIVNDDEKIQIELPNQITNNNPGGEVPKERIINEDDEVVDYGIPIVDIGSSTTGTISNDDIKF